MKYNIDADHLKALLEEMSNDAGRSISKGNTAIDDSDQLGLQLAKKMYTDPPLKAMANRMFQNIFVMPVEGMASLIELGYRMALSDIERAREVKELYYMFLASRDLHI